MKAVLSIILIIGIGPINANGQGEYPHFATLIQRIIALMSPKGSQKPITISRKSMPAKLSYTQSARKAKASARRAQRAIQEQAPAPVHVGPAPVVYEEPVAIDPIAPVAPVVEEAPPAQAPEPQQPIVPPSSVAAPSPTRIQELKVILVHLEEYVRNMYGCIVDFMDYKNTEKCPVHAQGFKKHLHILQEKVLGPLKQMGNDPLAKQITVIATELEVSQHKMYNILMAGYSTPSLILHLRTLNNEVSTKNRKLVTRTLPEIARYIHRYAPELSQIFNKIATQINLLTEHDPGLAKAAIALKQRA